MYTRQQQLPTYRQMKKSNLKRRVETTPCHAHHKTSRHFTSISVIQYFFFFIFIFCGSPVSWIPFSLILHKLHCPTQLLSGKAIGEPTMWKRARARERGDRGAQLRHHHSIKTNNTRQDKCC